LDEESGNSPVWVCGVKWSEEDGSPVVLFTDKGGNIGKVPDPLGSKGAVTETVAETNVIEKVRH
jgi:hypothetical protein